MTSRSGDLRIARACDGQRLEIATAGAAPRVLGRQAMTLSCSFQDGPFTGYGTCVGQTQVPAGCPIYFSSGTDLAPDAIAISVVDSMGQLVAATPTTTRVGTIAGTNTYVDVNDCDCPHVTSPMTVYQYMTTVPEAQAGDLVSVGGGTGSVVVTAAATCPPPDWPTAYSHIAACDLCPMPPPGDPAGTGGGFGGGCAAGGGGSLLVGLVAAIVLRRVALR